MTCDSELRKHVCVLWHPVYKDLSYQELSTQIALNKNRFVKKNDEASKIIIGVFATAREAKAFIDEIKQNG